MVNFNMHAIPPTSKTGFTLIELLVVLAIVATLLSLAMPRYIGTLALANEQLLQENLRLTRKVIDQYYADHGRYPDSLVSLVDQRYLKSLPWDPILESDAKWQTVAPRNAKGGVMDLHSTATGKNSEGKAFNEL